MDYIYLLVNNCEWDECMIYISEKDAIQASISYPHAMVQIFCKNDWDAGYSPMYEYYNNGVLYKYKMLNNIQG